MSKVYQVTGHPIRDTKSKRKTTLVTAPSKQVIWNNPSNYGFTKVFQVEDERELDLN